MPRLTIPDASLDTPLPRVMNKAGNGQALVVKDIKDIEDISFAGLATSLGRDPTRLEWSNYFESNMAQIRQGTITVLPANAPTAQLKSKSALPSRLAFPAAESRQEENIELMMCTANRAAMSVGYEPPTPKAAAAGIEGEVIGLKTQPTSPFTSGFGNAQANAVYLTKSGQKFGIADMPTIPQPVLDFGTGIADAVSFGLGPLARDFLGVDGGVNRCSTAYEVGQYGALGLGLGRMAYAGTVKAVSLMPSLTGRQASAIRNGMKRLFRGPLAGSKYRVYSYEQMLAEKGTDVAVKAAAGRTSRRWNALGIDAGAGGASNKLTSGCP